jgi:NAD(P) transhydrogenase subunit alpha
VKRLCGKKLEVVVESGAGAAAGVSDEDYRKAGATVADAETVFAADLVARVAVPEADDVAKLREGAALVSFLFPAQNRPLVDALAAKKVTALAVDCVPRTTLAQMMDVLSSQATVAGYRAVLLAAEALPRFCPMLVTAAGTIAPARFLILGAGVAGLQAIATARRLGAVVEAFDVRKVVKEQVESLGARFIEVPSDEDAQTTSGYAKELSDEYKAKQAALIVAALGRADAVITTALIPGKRAPTLVTAEQVAAMRPGSVLVDLAAEQGGNCELTRPGDRYVTDGGVTIIGAVHLASDIAVHASQMYSRNLEKMILHLYQDGTVVFDGDDEIRRGLVVTRAGNVVHPSLSS